nr:unnamed protein product [Callosobruchus analis]
MRKAVQMEGKVALIMGGTTEIGVLCVREMLMAGVGAVMIADEDEQRGREVVIELSDEYGTEKTAFIRTDFRCENLLKNAFERTLEHFRKIDVLVNIVNPVGGSNWKTEIDKNVVS